MEKSVLDFDKNAYNCYVAMYSDKFQIDDFFHKIIVKSDANA